MYQLSGGQRTRALLAKLLLSDPEMLLLDEPTNHLDIAATEWLESYLREWHGAVLLISHDRYFLDQVVNTIIEMTPAVYTYHGNYSAYLQQRQERWERAHGDLRVGEGTPGERPGLRQAQYLRAERQARRAGGCAA